MENSAVADACRVADGSDAVVAFPWSVLLDFFAAGASVGLVAGLLPLAAVGCAVECTVPT